MEDIVIKAKHLKVSGYLLILVILAAVIIFQYYYPNCSRCLNKTSTESEIAEPAIVEVETTTKESAVEEPSTTNTSTEENTTATSTEDNATNTSEEEQETPLTLSGEITFTIDDIVYEVKGEDWATITSIEYTIDNQKTDFTPTISAYLYDDSDDETQKDYVEETINLAELKAGKSITKTSSVHISFNDIDKTKTLKLILQDELDKKLKTAIKTFEAE